LNKLARELPKTLATHLHESLRWRIITGEIAAGAPLREQDIEREFGSSRGPVRESLRMLLQNGLVEYQQRRGFRVREYTKKYICDLYQLRASLEGLVIASLTGLDVTGLIEELNQSNKRMGQHFTSNDIAAYFAENQLFHDAIIHYTGNQPIAEVLVYVNEVSLPVRYQLLEKTLLSRRSLDYHEQIAAYIAEGKLREARAETEEHILCNMEQAAANFV